LEKLPLKVIRELETAAVIQVIDRVVVTSKHCRLYEAAKTCSDNNEKTKQEKEKAC